MLSSPLLFLRFLCDLVYCKVEVVNEIMKNYCKSSSTYLINYLELVLRKQVSWNREFDENARTNLNNSAHYELWLVIL